jgi:hypothetical protein
MQMSLGKKIEIHGLPTKDGRFQYFFGACPKKRLRQPHCSVEDALVARVAFKDRGIPRVRHVKVPTGRSFSARSQHNAQHGIIFKNKLLG